MKCISKGSPPAELQRWFEQQPIENGQRINCGYGQMPGAVKQLVKLQLLVEQGWLCCYTGQRIEETTAHIEHLKPQSAFKQNHEDVDYRNLLAAYPGENASRCNYGAHAKDNWYDEQLLISPLNRRCESVFRFDQFGRIKPNKESEAAATETINRLCLDNQSLTELRRQAIQSSLFRNKQPLRGAQLQRIAESYNLRKSDGKFPQFCFVIVQAAQELLRKKAQNRTREAAIQSQKAKK